MRTDWNFDGKGINGGDEYRSRIATLTEHGHSIDNAGELLAAAPDLLQACQNALAALEAQDNIHALPIAIWDAMQEMRVAIAIAKG